MDRMTAVCACVLFAAMKWVQTTIIKKMNASLEWNFITQMILKLNILYYNSQLTSSCIHARETMWHDDMTKWRKQPLVEPQPLRRIFRPLRIWWMFPFIIPTECYYLQCKCPTVSLAMTKLFIMRGLFMIMSLGRIYCGIIPFLCVSIFTPRIF